ncbi:MAG TPA: VCBS repeat-containing protein [Chthonomonadaceae bacterium]|nr:VCBS repeat-containing protein [Chthonomonadaceae bacterium]
MEDRGRWQMECGSRVVSAAALDSQLSSHKSLATSHDQRETCNMADRDLSRRGLIGGAIGVAAGTLAVEAGFCAPPQPAVSPPTVPLRIRFRKVAINEASDFEAASAADVNGDGRLDIVSGDTWYEAPGWKPHKFREIGVWGRGPGSSGYRADFADLPVDVNGDGRVDIVSSDYASGEIFWHENAGDSKDLWEKHLIAKPGSAETSVFAPILGSPIGQLMQSARRPPPVCILPNCGGKVVWYELRKAGKEPEWIEHIVGTQGAGHGIGFGDVNGDGKTDLITPSGWWEQVDAANDKWIWHGDWSCNPGDLGISTPTYDFDGDGRNEIVFGSGHHYGVYSLVPTASGKWEQRTIDNTWSQAHALILAPLEQRRQPVVLTGKRYLAHDHDDGAQEPLIVCYYRYNRRAKAWEKVIIDEGTHTGTGLQLTAVDLRRTGRLDLICPGKSGLYLFENHG